MTIYEIDRAIADLIAQSIDPETGEINLDDSALDALQMERNTKIENLALYIKNEQALSDALKAEAEALTKRKNTVDNRIDRLKAFLVQVCEDKKFQTPKVVCRFTDSTRTEINPLFKNEFISWCVEHRPELAPVKPAEFQPDKKKIKEAVLAGDKIPYVELIESRSVTVK